MAVTRDQGGLQAWHSFTSTFIKACIAFLCLLNQASKSLFIQSVTTKDSQYKCPTSVS